MYGKLFVSMFSGSLYGHWQAIVTFQQMIILADKDGTVEMTPAAISATTSIPLDIIEAGITLLEAPDPNSRTPDEDGRRLLRINPSRPWGWHITNYAYYRAIRTAEDRREYQKKYWQKRKQITQPDSTATQPIQPIVEVKVKAEAKAVTTTTAVAGLDAKAWETWTDYRKKIGKPLKPVSIPAAQRKLAALPFQMEAVEHSIANGWTGLFPAGKSASRKETTVERVRRLNSTVGDDPSIPGTAKRVDR